jgi:2-oxoglutarate ferredoxin oxidoreductase subunit alpha
LVITYGVTARAARDAVAALNRGGRPTALLVLKTLWPVPEELLRIQAAACERVVVIEMNLGQYVREIERVLAPREIVFYGQMNGELITPSRIEEVVING